MQKRSFDNLGVAASALGLGLMRLPTLEEGKINEEEAQRMVDRAMAAGITYYDTAYPYHGGQSEAFTGKALKKYDRKSFFLATKLPMWLLKEAGDVERLFHEQLAKLQTDYVDFYLLHALDAARWQTVLNLGVIETCEKLQAQGKIRHFGFSFHDEYPVFEQIITYRQWDFVQLQLNYMDVDSQQGIRGYELAQRQGVPVVVMEPIKGGSLANMPQDMYAPLLAADPGASPARWALRWVGSLPNVKVILSGMSTMAQLEDNIETFSPFKPLDDREQALIQDAAAAFAKRVRNNCTGCRYCMPCPNGVDIPGCFAAWNDYGKFANGAGTGNGYFRWRPEASRADKCVACGQCLEACPQHIAIIDDLAKMTAEFEPLKPADLR